MKTILTTLFIIVLISISTFSQNSIIQTLGTGGNFTIQDNTTTFFSLSQTNGNLTLGLGSSLSLSYTHGMIAGVIFKGQQRFIHDFQPAGVFGGNTFVGAGAGNFTMNGTNDQSSFNSAFGTSSFASNTTGHRNSAFGTSTLQNNTSGYQNSAFGQTSLNSNTTGYNNSAFGQSSLVGNTSGFNNSALGFYAGNNVTTGSNLTLIGNNAQPSSGSASNEITFGDGNITTIRSNVQSITSLSDARDKKNIKELNIGIDFLMKLQPRLFNWDKREWYDNNESDGSKMSETPTAGFIAQEFDELQTSENVEWLNLVLKTNPKKFEATSGNLLPIIVKAIQDLKKENIALKKEKDEQITSLTSKNENEILKLKTENKLLIKRLESYEEFQKMISEELNQLKEEKNITTVLNKNN